MAKEILVRTPLTTDGNAPVIGPDGKQVFSESILGYAAKAILEKRNQSLPQHLKVLISDVDEVPAAPVATKKTVSNATA